MNKWVFKSIYSLQNRHPIWQEWWSATIWKETYIRNIFKHRWARYDIDEYNNIYNEIGNTNTAIENITNCITTQTDLTLNETNHKIVCDATNWNITITLPTAVWISWKEYIITRSDNSINTVIIQPQVWETIFWATNEQIFHQYETLVFTSDNTNYL